MIFQKKQYENMFEKSKCFAVDHDIFTIFCKKYNGGHNNFTMNKKLKNFAADSDIFVSVRC